MVEQQPLWKLKAIVIVEGGAVRLELDGLQGFLRANMFACLL